MGCREWGQRPTSGDPTAPFGGRGAFGKKATGLLASCRVKVEDIQLLGNQDENRGSLSTKQGTGGQNSQEELCPGLDEVVVHFILVL